MEEVAEKKQNDLNKKKSFLDTFLGETTETDEIIIPYSSQYQAYDALTKILKSLFPKSIQGTFCTALKTAFNKERRLGLPKYVLYPSNQPKFFSVDEHKFIDIYGPG